MTRETEADGCPLWDGEADPPTVDDVANIAVFRIAVDEGSKRELPPIHEGMIPASSTHEDLAKTFGGGVYEVRALAKVRSRYLARLRIHIAGEPRRRGNAARGDGGPPVFESASGLASVAGLDPNLQLVFALMQQNSAQVREDARQQMENQTRMFEALAKRPEPVAPPPPVNPNTQILMQLMEGMRAELMSMRDQHAKLLSTSQSQQLQNVKLAMENKIENKPGVLEQIAPKIMERWDDIQGLLAMVLSGGKVIPHPDGKGFIIAAANGAPAALTGGMNGVPPGVAS